MEVLHTIVVVVAVVACVFVATLRERPEIEDVGVDAGFGAAEDEAGDSSSDRRARSHISHDGMHRNGWERHDLTAAIGRDFAAIEMRSGLWPLAAGEAPIAH